MKKNNKEGFVLAEAIVVGVFILSLFTFLFVNIVPLVGRYEAVEKYDTIDAVYNTNLIRMVLLENERANTILSGVNETHPYKKYTPTTFCDELNDSGSDVASKAFCKRLLSKEFLDVQTIFLTRYRLGNASGTGTNTIKAVVKNNGDFSREEREYILSLDNYTEPTTSTYDGYHRIIVEYKDGSFANLEIKK